MDPWHTLSSRIEEPKEEKGTDSTSIDNDHTNIHLYQFIPSEEDNIAHHTNQSIPTSENLHAPEVGPLVPPQVPFMFPHRHITLPTGENQMASFYPSVEPDPEIQTIPYNQAAHQLNQAPGGFRPPVSPAMFSSMVVPGLESKSQPLDHEHNIPVSLVQNKEDVHHSRPLVKQHSVEPASDVSLTKPVIKRSRMGCLTCRQRKKRCCERKPQCSECERLGLDCIWPVPGTEHRNKSRDSREESNTIEHEAFGKIKVLRGIVQYKRK